MIKTKRCQYCKEEIPLESVVCIHCNGALAAGPGVAVIDHFAAVKSALAEKYEIIAEIGQGGNATVYQAIQKNLDRKVALKILLPGLINDAGYMERFHLEARSIAKLHHPNIVTIYDEGSLEGVHFIAMEFLEGKDLHRIVRQKGRLTIREAIEMATCIASALDYAHRYEIIHRDVKSSNIIMTSTRSAVLTDFGIAQSNGTPLKTKSGSLLGTPEFMSPEQARGQHVDARTDFYSLGVVLYHTLSGHYPFQGDSPITTIHKILYENPVPLAKLVQLPPALEQAIDRCLEKDPEKRIRDGQELIALLAAATRTTQRPVEISAHASVVPSAQLTGEKSPDVQADAPDPATGEIPALRPPTRSAGPGTSRSGKRGARRFARTMMIAAAACLLATGYITWQRIPNASQVAKAQMLPPASLPERKLVPYLIGATQEEATKLLKGEGYEVGEIRYVAVPDPSQRGRVDTQRPAHGSVARPGTAVDLIVGE